MKRPRQTRTHSAGFTLIEMIISIVLVGIIVASISPLFQGSARSYYTVTTINENFQAARIGFNRMLSDLRELLGSTSILSGTSYSITFTDVNGSTITYVLSNAYTLDRTKTGTDNIPPAVLVPNVTGLDIEYFDKDGVELAAPLAAPANVWNIRVSMTVNVSGQSASFQGTASPRNIPFG